MSGSTKFVSYLPNPPVYNSMLKPGTTKPSDSFVNYFTQINLTLSEAVVHARIFDHTATPVIDRAIPLTRVTQLSEADRDNLQNPPNGAVILNTTTNRINFREDNAWWTFTRVAA